MNRPASDITKPGQAKINPLGPDRTPEVVSSGGIMRSDLRRLVVEVIKLRDEFLQDLDRIYGQSN